MDAPVRGCFGAQGHPPRPVQSARTNGLDAAKVACKSGLSTQPLKLVLSGRLYLRSLDRPLRGRFPAARGALAIGLRWPAATSFARSRSAAWPRRFLRGRGHAALDVIASGEVTVRRFVSEDMRAVRALPRPLPLPPRAFSLPLFDSLCPGTTSDASPRCFDDPLDEIIDELLAGRRWGQRWLHGGVWRSLWAWRAERRLRRRGAIVGDGGRWAVARALDGGGVLGVRMLGDRVDRGV